MKKKNLMRLSVGVAGAVFGLLPVAGHAEQTTTLSNGAELSVQLDKPSACEEINVPPGQSITDVTVEGQACVNEPQDINSDPDTGLIVVVDVSGSTSGSCGNGTSDSILQCEKTGVLGMLDPDVSKAIKEFGIVVFGKAAATADMQPDADDQLTTESSAQADEVADSIEVGRVKKYSEKDADSNSTNYAAALAKAVSIADAMSSPKKMVVFLSDGGSISGDIGDFNSELAELESKVDIIHSFAIGSSASCDAGSRGTLDQIAYNTSCRNEDPGELKNILPELLKPISVLNSVEVSMGGNPVPSTTNPLLPKDGPVCADFSSTIPGLAPGAYSDICAAVTGSDREGTATVQECVNDIQLLQLTASPETAVNEINSENSHTVKAEIVGGDGCSPEPRDINFVVSGQNSANGSVSALPNNEVQFTYTVPKSCDSLGTDTITVSTDIGGETASVALQKTWVDNTPPVATCESVNGKLQVNADDLCGVTLTVTDADGHVYPGIQPGDKIQYGQYQTSRMPHKQVQLNGYWVLVGHGNLTVTAVDASGNESSAVCPGTDRYSVRR